MEKVEPRQGIWEEEKSIGGRAGQYATGWSLLCSSLSLSFFFVCCEGKIQSSASPDIKQDSKVGECKKRGESVTIGGEMWGQGTM